MAAVVVLYFLSGMAQVYRCYVACNAVLLYSCRHGAGALCRCWRCTCVDDVRRGGKGHARRDLLDC